MKLFELDTDTIAAIKKGDRKVILDFYRYTFQLLMSSAVRYTNNQENQMQIVNNSFMKIVANIDKFQPGTAYFSWAKQIVKREIIDDFRKNKQYNQLFQFNEDYKNNLSAVNAEANVIHEEEDIQLILETLPPATKMVFVLYAIDGYSMKEIMEDLQISYETVKWHIKEARKKLKIKLMQNQQNRS